MYIPRWAVFLLMPSRWLIQANGRKAPAQPSLRALPCRKMHKQCANSRRQFNREAGEMLERAEAVESAQLKNDAERSEDEHPLSSVCINVRWPVQWLPSTSEP